MKIIITNKQIVIKKPTDRVLTYLKDILSYKDKSKEYQLRKMEKNSWHRNTDYYHELKKSVYGSLLEKIDSDTYAIPSGFSYLIDNMNDVEIDDQRFDNSSSVGLPWKKEPYALRDYQQEAVDAMCNNRRGLVKLATGLGKTLVCIHAIRRTGKKTLIVCPGKSIANQFYDQLKEAFGDHKVGYLGGGKKKIKEITVGIAATVNNCLDELSKCDIGMICIDETHHTPATTFYNIVDKLGDVGRIYGLTATDFRADGKDIMITAAVGPVIIDKDVIWGIKNKYLAEPFFFIREIKTTARDYIGDKLKNYKAHVLNNLSTKEIIETDIKKFIAAGKSVLCLVDEVQHGEELSNNLGIPFATGKDKQSEEYIHQLNRGDIPGLIGTDSKISEGVDTKNVDVLILANFVASRGPVLQAIGRALRKTDTKDKCIIVDYRILGSKQLARHCDTRINIYKEITNQVKII